VRGIALKIDDIWGLDLSMTGRVSDSVTRHIEAANVGLHYLLAPIEN
jgi:hypothetical protein